LDEETENRHHYHIEAPSELKFQSEQSRNEIFFKKKVTDKNKNKKDESIKKGNR